jgi:hypothetical protein
MQPWQTFPIQVEGGLITNVAPIQLGGRNPGAATRLVNFESSVKGGYRRINGFTKWSPDLVPAASETSHILGVVFFEGAVLAVREGSIYRSTGGEWTSIVTGRTHTTKHRYIKFNFDGTRKVLGTDGVNYPYTWDGTNFVNLTGSTDILGASHAIEFKDHIFYAVGSLVTFSEPFLENQFDPGDGAGSFRVDSAVTGFAVFRERLFIFTANKIHVLQGSSVADFSLSSVAEDIGCLYPDTIQEVGGDIMFLSADGLRLLGSTERNDDFANNVASKPIQSDVTRLLREYTGFSSVTVRGKSQYRLMCYLPGRPWQLSEGLIATQTLKAQNADNPEGFEWSFTTGIKSFVAYSELWNGQEYILSAGVCNASGQLAYVYRLESSSSFDGRPITAAYWTPYYSFEDPVIRKTIYTMTMYVTPEGTFSGKVNLDFDQGAASAAQPRAKNFSNSGGGAVLWDSAAAVWDSFNWSNPPDTRIRLQMIGSGKNTSLQFEFTNGDPFTIDTIMLEYSMNERR